MPLTVSKTGEVSDAWLAVAFAAPSGSETEREWSTTAEMPKSTTTAPAAAKGIQPPFLVFFSACHSQNAAALIYDPYPVFLWDHDRKSGNSCLKT